MCLTPNKTQYQCDNWKYEAQTSEEKQKRRRHKRKTRKRESSAREGYTCRATPLGLHLLAYTSWATPVALPKAPAKTWWERLGSKSNLKDLVASVTRKTC